MKCLNYILLLIFLILNFCIAKSQIVDTVQKNEVVIYHVQNQMFGSQLFWQVENAEIISENPTFADSIIIRWGNLAGVFNISVSEKAKNGCQGKTYQSQILIEEPADDSTELYVPNFFTPNEDSKNDYFTITATGEVRKYAITIFNRWGRKVFETHDINYSWDGRTQGNYCSPGVYFYVLTYQTTDRPKILKGFLHLYR